MAKTKSAIVMSTDFGKGISVSTMQGVCMMIDPQLRVFDCAHNIGEFDTYEASISLNYIIPFWPKGTVFISVVDPGVGSNRRAVVAKLSNGSYIVTPDNGSLTHAKLNIGIEEVRIIDEDKNRLKGTEKCSIFHGRDLFAYCGAKLASGVITYEEVGPKYCVEDIIMHEIVPYTDTDEAITGMIDAVDYHFGLICSNIPADVFEKNNINFGDVMELTIYNKKEDKVYFKEAVPYMKSFAAVDEGKPLLMVSETLHIQTALNRDNMSEKYKIKSGSDWFMKITKNRS